MKLLPGASPDLLRSARLRSSSYTIGGGPASPPRMPRAPPVALETANPPLPRRPIGANRRRGAAGGTLEPPGSCSFGGSKSRWHVGSIAPWWSSVQPSVERRVGHFTPQECGARGSGPVLQGSQELALSWLFLRKLASTLSPPLSALASSQILPRRLPQCAAGEGCAPSLKLPSQLLLLWSFPFRKPPSKATH